MLSTKTNKEKQVLLEKAEAYLQEWEEAKSNLEKSSVDFGKKLALVIIIGLSLIYVFQLLNSDDDEDKPKKRKPKSESRIFKALQSLAMPILLKGLKNIILSNEEDENDAD